MAFEIKPHNLSRECGFFVFMDMLVVLVCLWMMAMLCIGLLWYIWYQNESFREDTYELQQQYKDQLNLMQQERQNLYDRIQAGTLPQYKEYSPEPNQLEDTTEETVNLEEAREDLQPESEDLT